MTTPLAVTNPEAIKERLHHEFGPSRMEYLDNCAAFQNRQFTSDAADEGTMLHDLMEAMVKMVANKMATNTLDQLKGWVREQNELTEEQVTYLRFCCTRVDALLARKPIAIHVEINVKLKGTLGDEFNHGYLDVLLEFAGGVGVLIDYKFGWVPVPIAEVNLQGKNYTAGLFQMFPQLQKIGVRFYQPKLNDETGHVFYRHEVPQIISRLEGVVGRAKYVQKHPEEAQRFMAAGKYCEYCKHADKCAVLANHRALFAKQFHALPAPPSIAGLSISRPEDWALARYWVDIIEIGLEDFKKRAMEFAEQNGGELRTTLPSGEEIVYEVRERGADRVLGNAVEVAEVLKEYVTPAEILGAAKLSVTNLEPVVKTAMVEANKAAGLPKLTKKAAWERAEAVLTANGLLSRPDTTIKFLQMKKQQKTLDTSGQPTTPLLTQPNT